VDPEHSRLLEEGRLAFNRGEFYEAHEFWEEVWNVIDDPERTFVQGLIQAATGLHKLERQQLTPARTLLAKALAKLAEAPADFAGLAVGALRERLRHVDDHTAARSIKLGKVGKQEK
jgi:predicted metal-dependent hydrolase